MIARLALLAALLAAVLRPAMAAEEQIVADLSQRQVPITADFDGSELILFGAVKRETPISITDPLSVIITVAGPSRPVVVRRKERVAGIWVNTDAVEVDLAPSFYAVATSRPFNQILSSTEDLRYKISIPQAIRSVGAPMTIQDAPSFTEALIRIRANRGDYQFRPNTVAFFDQTLFKTSVTLPANLTEGTYKVTLYLTRNKQVVTSYTTNLAVQKVGMERWLYNLAHQQPLIYGILSIVIAIAAGWIASAVFRYFKG
ncbi:TIGR02186 family protein [Defluviimonas sp. D31]|uniref:TIGR02186 family protein n=1 Tax=Defluviimonas sp. D31 TaxID=3083253 RepID=UPI00296FFF27|nr:TIGR02186 family protein [Defluviimonas sp. D31]MDW4551019.1 TIGR02186 family protein [Defluviimonas sp. D31]